MGCSEAVREANWQEGEVREAADEPRMRDNFAPAVSHGRAEHEADR
jgi:hypothetical protein